MKEEDIKYVIKKLGKEITEKGKEILRKELKGFITLNEEAEYLIEEKGFSLSKEDKEAVIEELISRWDSLAEEELGDIIKEVAGIEEEEYEQE
ncbi:MAG: hypothetical protein QW734_07125 [Candidatus Bathyarchaeia archaeon]